jgi:hypothetical protein
MRVNDLDAARRVSYPSTWPEIEEWMSTHEIPPCKRIIEPLLIASGVTSGGSFYFGCNLFGGGGFYSSLEGAEFVEDSDGQFKIIAWETIIERYD